MIRVATTFIGCVALISLAQSLGYSIEIASLFSFIFAAYDFVVEHFLISLVVEMLARLGFENIDLTAQEADGALLLSTLVLGPFFRSAAINSPNVTNPFKAFERRPLTPRDVAWIISFQSCIVIVFLIGLSSPWDQAFIIVETFAIFGYVFTPVMRIVNYFKDVTGEHRDRSGDALMASVSNEILLAMFGMLIFFLLNAAVVFVENLLS